MSHNIGLCDHSKHFSSASIFRKLFTFLNPCAELQYQSDILATDKNDSSSTTKKDLPKSDIGEESAIYGWWW